MFVVDTNILFYATDVDSPDHKECKKFIDELRTGNRLWFVTWGILYEFLRITTHRKVLRNPLSPAGAWRIVESFFSAPNFRILTETDRHRHLVAEVFAENPNLTGNLVFDARTAILMRENGIKTIYTRDSDFARFSFIDAVDLISENRRMKKK